ncbi:MAG TPA: HAMP domain-containing sensor histidine kinase [Verrucomicrobiales bacterium]|nr:HAMP domain-containing sensor histidine kinase [Verrucomicrobiales bacterium]
MENLIPPPDTVIIGRDIAPFIEAGVRLAFPGSRVIMAGPAEEAPSQEREGERRMIIPGPADDAASLQNVPASGNGFPAAVAVLPQYLRTAEQMPGADVARMLQCEWETHFLRNENQRLSSDLHVIARRIGHDIRMHLSGIVSSADLLADFIPEPEDPQRRLTRSILNSVDEILVLLDRVKVITMTNGKVPAGQDSLVGDVAEAEGQRLEAKLQEQSATLKQPDQWPPVSGVHPWLKAIWSSLLTNAVLHGGEGVRIETGWRKNGDWRFWVQDNGPGVAPDRTDKLFPSIQSLQELHGASGSGLAIVRRLVEHMGGKCGYETPEGGGARFWFTLPDSSG